MTYYEEMEKAKRETYARHKTMTREEIDKENDELERQGFEELAEMGVKFREPNDRGCGCPVCLDKAGLLTDDDWCPYKLVNGKFVKEDNYDETQRRAIAEIKAWLEKALVENPKGELHEKAKRMKKKFEDGAYEKLIKGRFDDDDGEDFDVNLLFVIKEISKDNQHEN